MKLPEPRDLELETLDRPRDAFFGPAEAVPVHDAIGRTAAEQITPYPPMVLPDPADPKLETVRVTAEVLRRP